MLSGGPTPGLQSACVSTSFVSRLLWIFTHHALGSKDSLCEYHMTIICVHSSQGQRCLSSRREIGLSPTGVKHWVKGPSLRDNHRLFLDTKSRAQRKWSSDDVAVDQSAGPRHQQ